MDWLGGLDSADPGYNFWIITSKAGAKGMLSWCCWPQKICSSLHEQDPPAQCQVQPRQCIRTCWTGCEITSSANTFTRTAQHRLFVSRAPSQFLTLVVCSSL